MTARSLFSLALAVAACGSSGGSQSGVDAVSASQPTFLSFGTNVTSIDRNESVTFSAVLTSPAGNPLVGGTLADETGVIQYGAFESGSENGSFTLGLSWQQINQAAPLTFMSTDHRTFVASFFAADGAKASKTVSITFTCQGVSACDGSCFDLTSDSANCGSCGHQCAYNSTPGVDTKGCETSTCVYGANSATLRTCSAACTAVGLTCTDSCTGTTDTGQPVTYALAYYLSSHNVYSANCSETPPSGAGYEYCCCR